MKPAIHDWLLERHQAAYKFQLERSDKLRERISSLSTLLTLLGGAILYTAINYPHTWRGWWSLLFYAPACLSLILFVIAVWMILYCLGWGFQYSYIPTPKELQDYAGKIDAYASAASEEQVDALADIKEHMSQAYCTGATRNLAVNTRRSNLLLRATQIAIISFGLLLAALPSFFFDIGNRQTPPTRVIVTEPISIKQ
jgi:predicted PurR-regulated permease PerM